MLEDFLTYVESAGVATFDHVLVLPGPQIVVSLHLLERAHPFHVVLDVVLSGELPAFLDIVGPLWQLGLFLDLAEEPALIANRQGL